MRETTTTGEESTVILWEISDHKIRPEEQREVSHHDAKFTSKL